LLPERGFAVWAGFFFLGDHKTAVGAGCGLNLSQRRSAGEASAGADFVGGLTIGANGTAETG